MDLLQTPKLSRRYDIDVLRIMAILVIFFFHAARAFDDIPWEIKNSESFIGFTVFVVFVATWIMPLFFVLSGIVTFYSLQYKSSKEFTKDRVKRLLVPFVFGSCTIVAIQVYYEALFGNYYLPHYNGSFFEFYFFNYFSKGIYGFGGYFPLDGIYLWYLLWLFIFSLICLAFFQVIKKKGAEFHKLANFSRKSGGILIFVFPMIAIELLGIMVIPFLEYSGWNILVYLVLFIYGYIFASNPEFNKAIKKNSSLTLTLATFSSIILVFFYIFYNGSIGFIIIYIIFLPLVGLCWIITILGYASKYFNKNRKGLALLNELVLPFYIIHQSIIIMVDYYVIQLQLSPVLKFLIVLPIAFGLTIGMVLIVRKFNILRFLFGMRITKKK